MAPEIVSPCRAALPRMKRMLVTALAAFALPEEPAAADRLAELRERMVAEVAADARATASLTGRAKFSDAVMEAMRKVERHRFVAVEQRPYAYENRPLPIRSGQTISQPYIVALMTELLEVDPQDRVLEVGTGSGYQAAVLAELARTVYTIEIVEPLARQAAELFRTLGYRNIVTRIGDGYAGWPEEAPFDAIIVTAAPEEVPKPLIEQLRAGGRMVIPVGRAGATQELIVIAKQADGSTTKRITIPVRFVPLTRSPRGGDAGQRDR